MCHEKWAGSVGTTDVTASSHPIAVDDGFLPCHLYTADTPANLAPCVLVPDIYGTVPFYHEIARRLAVAGHPTALIDIFWRQGPLAEQTREAAFARRSGMDETQAVTDTAAAVDFLRERLGHTTTGVLGFCLGGTIALVLTSVRADLAVVSYYGFPEGVSQPARVPAPRPVDLAARMNGPILAFWGAEDYMGTDVMHRFAAAMEHSDADYEAHIYPGAGHGFLQGLVEGRPDSGAAADSWQRTLSFLETRTGKRSS